MKRIVSAEGAPQRGTPSSRMPLAAGPPVATTAALPDHGEHSLSVDRASVTADVEHGFYSQGLAVENAEVGSPAAEVWAVPLQDRAARHGHRAAAIVGTLGALALLALILSQ